MSRRFWIVALSLGAVAGFTAGAFSLHRGYGPCGCLGRGEYGFGPAQRAERIAEICVRAAERVRDQAAAGAPKPP